MAMLRLARVRGRSDLVQLVVSVRSPDDLYYRDELAGPETTVVYSRTTPPGSPRPAGRLGAADLAGRFVDGATVYVCGCPGVLRRRRPTCSRSSACTPATCGSSGSAPAAERSL